MKENPLKLQANENLKRIVNSMATIESKSEKGEATGADLEAYKSLTAEVKNAREFMDTLEVADAMKAWAHESDGNSAFKKSVSQEGTTPEDRDQEQRAQDNSAHKAYGAAFEGYLRRGSKVGPKDAKILEGGAVKADGMKVLTEGIAQAGGFTVPEQFQAEVLKQTPGLMGLNDVVRTQDTTRDMLVWPIIRYSATSTIYTAPHRLVFTGEIPASSATHRVTDQTFGEVRIPVNVAMASQLLSNSLIEDSATDIMGLTATLFRENIMQDVEAYLATGTGAGQPEGLFTNGLLRAGCTTSASAAGTTQGGVTLIYWNLPSQYRSNASWVFNSMTAGQIARSVDANGRYIWQASDMFGGGLGAAMPGGENSNPRLLGRPVIITEQAPAPAANAYFLAFGDMKGYIKANRPGMTVRVLEETYAEVDQKMYLLRYRFGGQVAENYKMLLLRAQV